MNQDRYGEQEFEWHKPDSMPSLDPDTVDGEVKRVQDEARTVTVISQVENMFYRREGDGQLKRCIIRAWKATIVRGMRLRTVQKSGLSFYLFPLPLLANEVLPFFKHTSHNPFTPFNGQYQVALFCHSKDTLNVQY